MRLIVPLAPIDGGAGGVDRDGHGAFVSGHSEIAR